MISAISTALSGLQSASKQVDSSAARITSGQSQDRVIEDIVDIKVAETAYKANIEVLKVADDLTRELIEAFDKTV